MIKNEDILKLCITTFFTDGKVSKENMVEFLKMLKTTSKLSDEEASKVAAAKIHESLPKSRMFYKIGASRNIGGGKKVDPKSQINDKLKVILPY